MPIDIRLVEPEKIRDDAVVFFWDTGSWAFPTIEECYRLWDWRYSMLSDGRTWAWVAREESGRIVGHIAVHERRYRIGETPVRVGVPGNFFVREEHRNSLVGPRLASLPRSLVKSGELDMVIAFGNDSAHAMFCKLGFRELGKMDHYRDVRRIGPALARRSALAGLVGPVVDGVLAARRKLKRRPLTRSTAQLDVRELNAAEFLRIDRSQWSVPRDRLVCAGSPDYIVGRFLRHPTERRRILALVSPAIQSIEGYVIIEGMTRVKVVDCRTNTTVIDPVSAICVVADNLQGVESIIVPALPDTVLAAELDECAFLHRTETDFIEARTSISAYWSGSHSAVDVLEDTRRWNLWIGANHY